MTVMLVFVARYGSTVDPESDFLGRPLYSWTLLQARNAMPEAQVILVSDSQRLLDGAEKFGADLLYFDGSEADCLAALIRPNKHGVEGPGTIAVLSAFHPLRRVEDIVLAVRASEGSNASVIFSGVRRKRKIWLDGFGFGQTADAESAALPIGGGGIIENGSIYAFRAEIQKDAERIATHDALVHEMPEWSLLGLDHPGMIPVAEAVFECLGLDEGLVMENTDTIPAADLDLIVYDFDGVMTDNRVLVMQDGTEGVMANRGDGLGISMLKTRGIPQLILSTETNPVVRARADKLKLDLIDSCQNKRKALLDYCRENGHDPGRVVFVGNDINDKEAMETVRYPVAPADAHPAIAALARLLTHAKGGHGVIRELAGRIV